MSQNDSSTTEQLRQKNPDESEKMAKLDHQDGDVYGYLSRNVADQLGEYLSLTISEEADVMAEADGVTGSGSGNFVTFETPGGAVVGLGIHHDLWSEVLGTEVERDDDGNVTNAPDSIGLEFAASDEDAWEEAGEADPEEVEGLIAGDDSDDSDDEEEVEIEDEELDLVAEEE
jgi:hypothetical protein